ncbi:MAG TPA: DinB family protein [Pirellulales bacterium]|jgi:hypothetical protein
MNANDAIRHAITGSDKIVNAYLGDLTDAELLARPVPGANHIAWQLGHLIQAEHDLINMVCPGSMPALPEGFKKQHAKETAALDDPKAFHTKAEYLKLMGQQRAATLAALGKVSEADLDRDSPEPVRAYCAKVADVFLMQPSHVMMHAGQWAVTRRKLGRKPLF